MTDTEGTKLKVTPMLLSYWFSAGMLMWMVGCSLGLIFMFSVRSMLVGAEHANWLDYLRMTGQYSVQDILSILAGALLAGMVISIVGLIILWGLIPRNKFIVWALLNMTSVSAAVFLGAFFGRKLRCYQHDWGDSWRRSCGCATLHSFITPYLTSFHLGSHWKLCLASAIADDAFFCCRRCAIVLFGHPED